MSVRLKKVFSNSNEIWNVGRGQWVMHDGMPYDLIQGQGYKTFKVRNSSIFKIHLSPPANDHWFWNYGTISKFCMDQIFDICPSFCVAWLRTLKGLRFRRSRPQSLTGLIFYGLLHAEICTKTVQTFLYAGLSLTIKQYRHSPHRN